MKEGALGLERPSGGWTVGKRQVGSGGGKVGTWSRAWGQHRTVTAVVGTADGPVSGKSVMLWPVWGFSPVRDAWSSMGGTPTHGRPTPLGPRRRTTLFTENTGVT